MTTLSQSTKRKLSLLQLAEELGNVSKACKIMGYHRDTFYEAPAATLNSPIRGRVKFPQLTTAGRCVFTRSERALQLERRPPSDASSCPRTSADASGASGDRAAA